MRYKNYGLWVAIGSLILILLQDTGINISPERYQVYVDSLLHILVLLGIISNPKDGSWYKDESGGNK